MNTTDIIKLLDANLAHITRQLDIEQQEWDNGGHDDSDAARYADTYNCGHLEGSAQVLSKLRDELLAAPAGFVYTVRLPGDEFIEVHIFADMEDAYRVRDAVDDAQVTEEPILDTAFANLLIEQNA